MNIAIIGPGGIADDQHAPAIRAHAQTSLWSVLSRSEDRARAFAERHEMAAPRPAYTVLDELLADTELDAVVIASPDRLHARQVVACAEAGKHILLEKPMATSVEECICMIDACERNRVTLAMAYHLRWHAGHRIVQKLIQDGALGTLRHVRIHWTFEAPDGENWRSLPESGRWWSLAANGTHCLDMIRWMMCANECEITDLRCLISKAKFNSVHDETAMVSMLFKSGATAEFCVSVQFDSESRIEIYGDMGEIRMEGTMGRHGSGEIRHNGKEVQFEIRNPFLDGLNDFVEAVAGVHKPEVGAEEGLKNVEILLQAIRVSGSDHYF